MLSKESKVQILEGFYGLDYVFFGEKFDENKSCCQGLAEEYLTTKSVLLNIVSEMQKLVEHSPEKIEKKITTENLHKRAKSAAKHVRENVRQILTSEKGRSYVKESVKQDVKEKSKVNPTKESQKKIREVGYQVAIDNMLVARTLRESNNPTALNEWEGIILEESYKVIRDQLAEIALTLADQDNKQESQE